MSMYDWKKWNEQIDGHLTSGRAWYAEAVATLTSIFRWNMFCMQWPPLGLYALVGRE